MNKLDRYKQARADADRNRKRIADEEATYAPLAFFLKPMQKEPLEDAYAHVMPENNLILIKHASLTAVQAHRLAEWILDLVRE